jgi:hypothetical protein
MADMQIELPMEEGIHSRDMPLAWKKITARMQGTGRRHVVERVQAAVGSRRRQLDALEARLWALQQVCAPLHMSGKLEGLDGFMDVGNPGSDARRMDLHKEIGECYASLQNLLLECIPDLRRPGQRRPSKDYQAWSKCIGMLRILRNVLTTWATSGSGPPRGTDLQGCWASAVKGVQTRRRREGAGSEGSQVETDWDDFLTNTRAWAEQLDLTESAVEAIGEMPGT